jgi:8-oxo-dGTP pyrophosphatase MutT (NUDIX family)
LAEVIRAKAVAVGPAPDPGSAPNLGSAPASGSEVPASGSEVAAFLARAAARLLPEPVEPGERPRGDHSLQDDQDMLAAAHAAPRRAAVLVPVVPREGGVTVLFTERAAHLRDHAGQVAFPGGKIDAADPSPRAAALREAFEEIGLTADRVRVLGYLDPYLSGTGFLVTPVVGLVALPLALVLNPAEVAASFEVPLAHLLDPARHELHEREWRGRLRRYYAIPYDGRVVWGVTAGIVRSLYERLAEEEADGPGAAGEGTARPGR